MVPMRITVLALSNIPDDPRVMRQIRLLESEGHAVRAVGFGRENLDGILENFPLPEPGWKRRLVTGVRLAASRIAGAENVYWLNDVYGRMLEAVVRSKPEIIHANDWIALPIAMSAARKVGGRVLYDSHEYAVGEREDSLLWRLLFRPYIGAIEGRHIRSADAVVTVSDGIASRLRHMYGLASTPDVIRNIPSYSRQHFRASALPLKVLYHGAFNPDRNLEALIASVAFWTPDRMLILRGMGPTTYVDKLRDLARQTGAGNRIEFVPPVAPGELIAMASEADIGIHPIAPLTIQTNCCLPNKFFEYIMAGLCLVVSPAEEMARLVRNHGVGIVLANTDSATIARSINELTPEAVNDYKTNSLKAARILSWDRERHRLMSIYERVASEDTDAFQAQTDSR